MLSTLSRTPRAIDEIIEELLSVFQDVDFDTLKADVIEFFEMLADQGFLSVGETVETCIDKEQPGSVTWAETEMREAIVSIEKCSKDTIGPNDFLRSIHFDISSACNERCVHCYIPEDCKTSAIDPSLFYQTLEDARRMNIVHVTLSGGEPLLHKDLIGFLARCRELDLSVNVLSNLTLLTDEVLAEMKRNPLLSVQTSLYSMSPAVHDLITQKVGSFEKTLSGVLKIISAGIPVQISCPVMVQNKDSFLDVVVWGKEHNVAVAIEPIIFAPYDHSGSNLENRITLDELENVLDKELSEGYGSVLCDEAKVKELLTGNDPICSVCRYSLCVSVDGNVFPCAGWQDNVLGDLRHQTLQEIWEHSEKLLWLRKVKRSDFPQCVNCENKGFCAVCMMCNSNENPDGNPFLINEFHCNAAAIVHRKIREYHGNA